jgi:hypothetical protein
VTARQLGRGQCADCGGWVRIVGFGDVARHDGSRLGLAGDCPGSGKQPADPVHCADCGRAGLALQPSSGCCGACAAWRWRDPQAAAGRLEAIRRGEWGVVP